jgi:hypothetical protein
MSTEPTPPHIRLADEAERKARELELSNPLRDQELMKALILALVAIARK